MRVELFELRFHNANSVFVAGQTVSGSVALKLCKPTQIDSLKFKFEGRAKSKWEVSDGDTSKVYKATETYINREYQLYRRSNDEEIQPTGLHLYPFDFVLPPDIPSSFVGRRGYVRYTCTVKLDRGWKGVMKIEEDLTVIRHLDLSTVASAAHPLILRGVETYQGCCCDSGDVEVKFRLDKSGFVCGEPMHYDLTINNQATSSISGVTITLVQSVRYTGYSDSFWSSGNPKYHDKTNDWLVFRSDDMIYAGKTAHIRRACTVPTVAPSMLEGCNIIDISYDLLVTVPVGWSSLKVGDRIYIGTIPLPHPTYYQTHMDNGVDESSVDLELSDPPFRYNQDLPPSYEECVFGRMESAEGDGDDDIDDDESDEAENETAAGPSGSGGPPMSASSRRSRFHRLPSYPHYSAEQFISRGDNHHQNTYPNPPPAELAPPITQQPESSALPPPPAYETLQLQ